MIQFKPSWREILATFISRQIHDNTVVAVGTGLPVPRAGVLLAHFTHAPNMTVVLGPYACNLLPFKQVFSFEFFADWRYSRYAEATVGLDEIMGKTNFFDVFFVSGLQVDKFGNVNLFGIRDGNVYRLKGPGPIGVASLTTNSRRFIIYLERHDARTLVDRCDLVSAMGWCRDNIYRGELGLRGGPEYIVTPLAVFSFDTPTRQARLKYLMPGVTVDQAVAQTGFTFDYSDVKELQPPSDEELRVLREKVDPEGKLRLGGI
ncbi:MAG: hypothetical protein QXR26_04370 [Candidatus Caldarchaeum sp.]